MIDMILNFLPSLLSVPKIGPILVVVVGSAAVLAGVATGVVTLWHGAVQIAQSLAKIPHLGGLQCLADAMKADEDKIDAESNIALGILNRLSVIPLPKA
jgi:hypothetical protein